MCSISKKFLFQRLDFESCILFQLLISLLGFKLNENQKWVNFLEAVVVIDSQNYLFYIVFQTRQHDSWWRQFKYLLSTVDTLHPEETDICVRSWRGRIAR